MLHTLNKQATEKQTLCHMNRTNKHKQHNNAKGPQHDKTWKHPQNQIPNFVVYKDTLMHAPSQARRLRPNSLAKDAHNQLQSRFSLEWKLILWQELLNLPETHTATDHKGISPFPKEGRSKAPANNKAMAYHPVSRHLAQTCTSGKSYEKSRKVCILQGQHCTSITSTSKTSSTSKTCKELFNKKRFQNTSYHNMRMLSIRLKYQNW